MSTVIVGFDFSTRSAKAVDLAIDIANRWHSDLRLVYVKKSPTEDEAPIREEIERRNAGVAHLLQDIKMDYVVLDGKVSDELIGEARRCKASLIVVGTNGMSGLSTNFIGRNTYKTITDSEMPVLNVRENFNFNKVLENIVLPIDFTSVTRQKVPITAKFASMFGATIHIVGLYTSDSKDIRGLVNNYVDQVEKYLDKSNIKHVTVFLDAEKNLTTTTLDYADKVNADLITIMTEQERSLSNWRIGTFAAQMLNTSKHPILSIRPEQIGTESR
ncbi:MAG: universal stress protein [Bacteroidales bacterium]|nr:universal stress protein [Bacteroidales bacterium]